MKFKEILITPKIAKFLLTVNFGNRPIKRSNVLYWRSLLIGNAVTRSHQGIAIEGTIEDPVRLLDGQHRLIGIVETGISAVIVICENAPPESFMNLDNGMPRSMADRAGITSREAQMANSFFYSAKGGATSKPPVLLIREINDIISPFAAHVADKRARAFSIVPIRAAFVAQQKVYGTNLASEFQNGQFGVLTNALNALYRRQSTRPMGSSGATGHSVAFCSAWRAITRPSMVKIHAPESPSEEAREIVAHAFPEIIDAIGRYSRKAGE